ncbi:hypothetical protein RN001_002576 [Aquatica leii]|uniref:Uncharacterized protein n=1 Tax=Aquatica leii TaxID=1421715 RepID=A0AAN7SSV3_9COLE|nr:hypothetical protein RN001_002576 [Aquatica leii]
MSDEKHLNLIKKTLPELKELLDRQTALIRNKKLLANLRDKGESAKQLLNKIEKEIQLRQDLEKVENSLSNLKITKDAILETNEKHVEYVCSKEKPIKDTRYRPHRTLIHKEIKSFEQKSTKKFNDTTSAYEPSLVYQPTQCISLLESLSIQKEQARKVTEEQTKRFLQGFQDYNESESDNENAQNTDTLED